MGLPVEWTQDVHSRNHLLGTVDLVEHHHRDNHLGLPLPHVQLRKGASGRRCQQFIGLELGLPNLRLHFGLEAEPWKLLLDLFPRAFDFPLEQYFVKVIRFVNDLDGPFDAVHFNHELEPDSDHFFNQLNCLSRKPRVELEDRISFAENGSEISFFEDGLLLHHQLDRFQGIFLGPLKLVG